jgi:hypothetical protein
VPTLPPTPPAATATLESTATPPNAETGVLRFADDFSRTGRWSTVQQELWNVGYSPTGSGYLIQAEPQVGNIWSYITTPGDPDYSVGVTITTPQPGLAGVLVRFQDRGNYVVCLINPGTQRYRIEQRSGGRLQVVAAGVSPVALDAAEGTRLVVRLRGNGLTLLLNGVLVEDQTLVGLPATTQLGLVAAGDSSTVEARFRDLEVRELP